MSQNDISEEVAELAEEFEAADAEIDTEFAQERFEDLQASFGMQPNQAIENIREHFLNEHDLTNSELYSSQDSEFVSMGELEAGVDEMQGSEDDFWCSVRGEILSIRDEEDLHDAVEAQGYWGDDDGRAKFTIFENSPFSYDFEVGDTVEITNVAASKYAGTYEISLNSNTEVTEIDAEFNVPEPSRELVTISGVVAEVKNNDSTDSGLIQRCPEDDCSYVLEDGHCREHGNVDGQDWDLRAKTNVSDGTDTYNVIFGSEQVKEILEMDIDEAVKSSREAMDTSVITNMLIDALHGEAVEVEAVEYENEDQANNYFVDEMALASEVEPDAVSATRNRIQEVINS